jgi:hypothetical protein
MEIDTQQVLHSNTSSSPTTAVRNRKRKRSHGDNTGGGKSASGLSLLVGYRTSTCNILHSDTEKYCYYVDV